MTKPRVVNSKKEDYTLYIGRPSKWGNPFSHLPNTMADFFVSSREEAVDKYEDYLRNNKYLIECLGELDGKILGCFCKPQRCHGDILIKLFMEKFHANITDKESNSRL